MIRQRLALCFGAFAAIFAATAPALSQETIFGMTAANSGSGAAGVNLVSFSSATPGTLTTIGAFSGINAGHSLRSIDFRPSNNLLYAVSTNGTTEGQLYTVNLSTAALTAVGSPFTMTGNTATSVDIDFNPVTDVLHIVTRGTVGNNHRVNPNTGALISTDTALAYAPGDANVGATPSISGIAFSNNTVGAASTTLFGWDYNNDALVTIGSTGGAPNPPSSGLMNSVNTPTGFLTFNAGIGMDVSGATNTLYVTHDDPATGTSMSLFTRDMTTGAETLIGSYGAVFVADISVQPIPEPASLLVGGVAVLGAVRLIRRRRAVTVV